MVIGNRPLLCQFDTSATSSVSLVVFGQYYLLILCQTDDLCLKCKTENGDRMVDVFICDNICRKS